MTNPRAEPGKLREILEKYDLLLELSSGPADRTPQRRDLMRQVARRFPTALREWESLSRVELQRRRDVVAALLEKDEATQGSLPTSEPWLIYGLDLHARLRQLLHLRRLRQDIKGGLVKTAYAEVAEIHGVEPEQIKAALFHSEGESIPSR